MEEKNKNLFDLKKKKKKKRSNEIETLSRNIVTFLPLLIKHLK